MSTTTYAQRTITVILDAAIPMSMTTGFAAAPVQHTSSPTSITTPATPLSTALPSNHSDEEIARALERIATELEHALASTVDYLARLLAGERARRGTRRGQRALEVSAQAVRENSGH
ncbi:hypothetical protein [Pseudonocardia sp. ICBG1142]|uniref:hypothetical protein n=1 Tax=Pseudonocardia sp. ICBG1142 TaxID=2846760 RepID=UPI001CF692A7|nr:hypothetical protein [Pseudonocardia sp. ICBG1142]